MRSALIAAPVASPDAADVMTCGGQLLAEDMLWFGHGAGPVPMGRLAWIAGDAASQSHVAITRWYSAGRFNCENISARVNTARYVGELWL
jgi:hypothetical protein